MTRRFDSTTKILTVVFIMLAFISLAAVRVEHARAQSNSTAATPLSDS